MERVIEPDLDEGAAEVAKALERKAGSKGRGVADELKDIAAGTPPLSNREQVLDKLAERRKKLASRAFPDGE